MCSNQLTGTMTDVLLLTTEDLTGLAEPSDYVDAVREGYRDRGQGGLALPRTRLARSEPWGMLTGYQALLPGSGAMGGYLYSAGFQARDAWFVLPLFDATTGEPLAILDGSSINPLKTGAAGAVAIDELARPEASRLALYGSGNQALGQLACAAAVRALDQVRVYSPTPGHREAFAKHATDRLGIDVQPAQDESQALEDADIVITATRAKEPVFNSEQLPDGVHITAMGQYHPERRELDGETVARALYVADLRERVLEDSGELLGAIRDGLVGEDHIHAELGEVVSGRATGRASSEHVTLFDSGGTGIETVAAAKMLYERAVERGRGTRIELTPASRAMERPW